MEGDFKGDFTRDTFDPIKRYSRVLMQQGRVQLDADWNEQTDILLYFLRTLAADLIGPHGGPGDSFKIGSLKDANGKAVPGKNFVIQPGNYYVDGILCGNPSRVAFIQQGADFPPQPDYTPNVTELDPNGAPYLVYLDVWERQKTSLEDANIREVALGLGEPDTATRAEIIWQVKVVSFAKNLPDYDQNKAANFWTSFVKKNWQSANRGQLKAMGRVKEGEATNACITPPDACYRGAENQLYRVEIHTGGTSKKGASFKWSRENASLLFPYTALTLPTPEKTMTITLDNLGRDEGRFSLQKDDWVEFIDNDRFLFGNPGALWQVFKVDPLTLEVTLGNNKNSMDVPKNRSGLLRLWNYKTTKGGLLSADDYAVKVVEDASDAWLTLEDGIQIQFQPGEKNTPANYRTGDYWLIPARTATGDIEWPQQPDGTPKALDPHGVEHHYAPLALIRQVLDPGIAGIDLRYVLNPIVPPVPPPVL